MIANRLKQKRDCFINNTAKRPGGSWAVKQYNTPRGHYRSFTIIMDALALTGEDRYCEIGCGGGILLKMALEKAGSAAALDHSPDMVELTCMNNQKALDSGRLEVIQGSAEALPWPGASFTACASANMFFFVTHPQQVLSEIYRILAPGGRFSMVTAGKSAPTLITMGWFYRLNTYSDPCMSAMLKKTGFKEIRVRTNPLGFDQICSAKKPHADE